MDTSLKYFVLFCFIGLLDAIKFRCDYNYYGVGWFKYNEVPMTWNDARLYCQLQGAKLASPINPDIKAAMINLITHGDVFSGFHSTLTKGQFYSLDGTSLSNILHTWAEGEPDNKKGLERCIAINSDGDMLDVQCNEPKPFICYRANSTVEVNECGTLDPEYQLDTRTNKCYKFHTNARDFYQANFICSAEGAHLAIINSETESKVLSDVFAKYPSKNIAGNFWKEHAFIGFNYWEDNTQWTTIHDQSIKEAGFDKFADKEPNNAHGGETCGSVNRAGLLNDLKCEYIHTFICEKEPNVPSICDSTHYYNVLNEIKQNHAKLLDYK